MAVSDAASGLDSNTVSVVAAADREHTGIAEAALNEAIEKGSERLGEMARGTQEEDGANIGDILDPRNNFLEDNLISYGQIYGDDEATRKQVAEEGIGNADLANEEPSEVGPGGQPLPGLEEIAVRGFKEVQELWALKEEAIKFGSVVWGRVTGYPWWPAKISINENADIWKKNGRFWVSFFNDDHGAWLFPKTILPWNEEVKRACMPVSKRYKDRVLLAIEEAEEHIRLMESFSTPPEKFSMIPAQLTSMAAPSAEDVSDALLGTQSSVSVAENGSWKVMPSSKRKTEEGSQDGQSHGKRAKGDESTSTMLKGLLHLPEDVEADSRREADHLGSNATVIDGLAGTTSGDPVTENTNGDIAGKEREEGRDAEEEMSRNPKTNQFETVKGENEVREGMGVDTGAGKQSTIKTGTDGGDPKLDDSGENRITETDVKNTNGSVVEQDQKTGVKTRSRSAIGTTKESASEVADRTHPEPKPPASIMNTPREQSKNLNQDLSKGRSESDTETESETMRFRPPSADRGERNMVIPRKSWTMLIQCLQGMEGKIKELQSQVDQLHARSPNNDAGTAGNPGRTGHPLSTSSLPSQSLIEMFGDPYSAALRASLEALQTTANCFLQARCEDGNLDRIRGELDRVVPSDDGFLFKTIAASILYGQARASIPSMNVSPTTPRTAARSATRATRRGSNRGTPRGSPRGAQSGTGIRKTIAIRAKRVVEAKPEQKVEKPIDNQFEKQAEKKVEKTEEKLEAPKKPKAEKVLGRKLKKDAVAMEPARGSTSRGRPPKIVRDDPPPREPETKKELLTPLPASRTSKRRHIPTEKSLSLNLQGTERAVAKARTARLSENPLPVKEKMIVKKLTKKVISSPSPRRSRKSPRA